MNKPETYTIIPGLLAEVPEDDVVELNSDSTPGGDWYSLLRHTGKSIYYVALNGEIFLVTLSDMVAYNAFYQAFGWKAKEYPPGATGVLKYTIKSVEASVKG